jgi:glycerophosphoryl diester phosphodiesterase
LTAKPIAHRGLHDAGVGIIENTAGAVQAALAAGYGIEVDLQISADGEAMVHHDPELGRITDGTGRLDQMTAAALRRQIPGERRAHADARGFMRFDRRPRRFVTRTEKPL